MLISGESGTGKELVARTLHEMSSRRKAPFVAVNCSAIPETLLESELFGHEKGAFTGALERRAGYFELADKGTIFLDEIVEMSPALQAKYLRILQEGQVRRLGGKGELSVDVRIIAATNKDPMKAVKDGTFREDLFYRLNVFSVAMPPLRQRKEDIPLLVEAFVEEFNAKYDKRVKGLDDAAVQPLMQWSWPGNVRELRNVIERATVACPVDIVTRDLLPLSPAPRAATPRRVSPLTTRGRWSFRSARRSTTRSATFCSAPSPATTATRPVPPTCSVSPRRPSAASSRATRGASQLPDPRPRRRRPWPARGLDGGAAVATNFPVGTLVDFC